MAHTEIFGTLLAIGDEILLGDIENTNARHIALELRANGLRVAEMRTVPDVDIAIVSAIHDLLPRSAFLIATGGLGPTDDDRTLEAVAHAFSRRVTPEPRYTKAIEALVASRGRPFTPFLAKMCSIPEGAKKLGPARTWAGFFIEHEGTPCWFLPGIPHEMRTLLAEEILPELDRRFPERRRVVKRVLRVQSIVESEVNRLLSGLAVPAELAYYPQGIENWVALLATGDTPAEAEEKAAEAARAVTDRLGAENISGGREEPLEQVVVAGLKSRGWRLAVAESCTGGLLGKRVTDVSGASDVFERGYVTYGNGAKVECLGVSRETLRDFGAVSEPCAREMAEGARRAAGTDVALSVTGIAGPDGGTPEKPVGLVFTAFATGAGTRVERHLLPGNRDEVRARAAQAALVMLWREMR